VVTTPFLVYLNKVWEMMGVVSVLVGWIAVGLAGDELFGGWWVELCTHCRCATSACQGLFAICEGAEQGLTCLEVIVWEGYYDLLIACV
jgi:hypothetical protein